MEPRDTPTNSISTDSYVLLKFNQRSQHQQSRLSHFLTVRSVGGGRDDIDIDRSHFALRSSDARDQERADGEHGHPESSRPERGRIDEEARESREADGGGEDAGEESVRGRRGSVDRLGLATRHSRRWEQEVQRWRERGGRGTGAHADFEGVDRPKEIVHQPRANRGGGLGDLGQGLGKGCEQEVVKGQRRVQGAREEGQKRSKGLSRARKRRSLR